MNSRRISSVAFALVVVSGLRPASVLGCAACFGQSDSSLAVGMNWGIAALLGVVVFVLGGVATFFIYLAKRAATVGESEVSLPAAEQNKKV